MRYLVPLDGSALAEQALPSAKERAVALNDDILLVRVVNVAAGLAVAPISDTVMGSISAAGIEALQQGAEEETRASTEYLEKKAQELRLEGLNVTTEIRTGTPASEIIASAMNNRADMIIITTHGRSGLGRLVFGSVSGEVIRGGNFPVLVINSK